MRARLEGVDREGVGSWRLRVSSSLTRLNDPLLERSWGQRGNGKRAVRPSANRNRLAVAFETQRQASRGPFELEFGLDNVDYVSITSASNNYSSEITFEIRGTISY